MTFETTLRYTELLLGIALSLQCLEHLTNRLFYRPIFILRLCVAILLIGGIYSNWMILVLFASSLFLLYRFQGPYNGGSDRMGLLIQLCLLLAHWLPNEQWRHIALAYLALQLILSYVISGWVKIKNPNWRNGTALIDVFLFSAYPASDSIRAWHLRHSLLLYASWFIIVLELFFPLFLLHTQALYIGLTATAIFHLANALLFGLNRFFWTWLSAYPAIIWFQINYIHYF